MGREIRRVPEGWEHPRDDRGRYRPMFDRTYEHEAIEWVAACVEWAAGEHVDQTHRAADAEPLPAFYWDWAGDPPDATTYRPAFDSEPTHYQFYENVSEGTPLSPVFATLAELEDWLVTEGGYGREGAHAFCERGSAPSMVMTGGHIVSGIDAMGARA